MKRQWSNTRSSSSGGSSTSSRTTGYRLLQLVWKHNALPGVFSDSITVQQQQHRSFSSMATAHRHLVGGGDDHQHQHHHRHRRHRHGHRSNGSTTRTWTVPVGLPLLLLLPPPPPPLSSPRLHKIRDPFVRYFVSAPALITTLSTNQDDEHPQLQVDQQLDSTTTTTMTTTNSVDAVWRQTTQRLLSDETTPVGGMDAKQWGEAHASILHWLEQQDDGSGSHSGNAGGRGGGDADGIVLALDLLDRLVREEESILQWVTDENDDKKNDEQKYEKDVGVPSFYETRLLNLVLNQWRQHIRTAATKQKLHPRTILDTIYRYQTTSRFLQPNFQTFGMLMDGVAALVGDAASTAINQDEQLDLVKMVNEIVDRLVAQAIADEEESSSNRMADSSDNTPTLRGTTVSSPPPPPRPNVWIFSTAMNVWVKSGRPEAPERVEELLQLMKDLAEHYPNGWGNGGSGTISAPGGGTYNDGVHGKDSTRIAPNRVTYSTVIDTWAKAGRVDKVKDLLQEMYLTNEDELKPGIHAFNGLLVALSKNGSSNEAEAVLSQMEHLYESGDLDEPPNEVSYTTVLNSFSRSRHREAAAACEALFRRMMDRPGVEVNAVTYNTVLNAHVKAGNVDGAESILREMQDAFARTGNADLKPTLQTYGTILSGIARTKRRDAGDRAERILDHLKHLSDTGELDLPLDTTMYNVVLDCFVKSASPDAATRAKMLVKRMREEGIARDVITYNTLIHCVASAEGSSPLDAERILDEMEEDSVPKNATTYNTLLASHLSSSSLPKSRSQSNHRNRRAQEQALSESTYRAERLFQRIKADLNVQQDIVTYNTLLHFYALRGDALKAEALLDEVQHGDAKDVEADATTFNTVINAWANSTHRDGPERAEALLNRMLNGDDSAMSPNTVTFNSVMSAWIKSRRAEAVDSCERIFQLLEETPGPEPDLVTFNLLIHSLSFASDKEAAPDRAEAILKEMQRRSKAGESWLQPGNRTIGSMIAVWCKCRTRPESGEMAELYLRQIIRNTKEHRDRAKPRVFEFASAIRAWQNSGSPKAPYKADEIFALLLHEYEKEKNKLARPNDHFFGAILATIADSSTLMNKAKHADKIVHWMKKCKIEPNDFLMRQLEACYREHPADPDKAAAYADPSS